MLHECHLDKIIIFPLQIVLLVIVRSFAFFLQFEHYLTKWYGFCQASHKHQNKF